MTLAAAPGESLLVGLDDLLDEFRVVAAGFAADVDIVGHDVRRLAGALAVAPGDAADVRRAGAVLLADLAEPAASMRFGQGQGENQRRRDALLRVDAGVRRFAQHLDLPAFRPDGRRASSPPARGRPR